MPLKEWPGSYRLARPLTEKLDLKMRGKASCRVDGPLKEKTVLKKRSWRLKERLDLEDSPGSTGSVRYSG